MRPPEMEEFFRTVSLRKTALEVLRTNPGMLTVLACSQAERVAGYDILIRRLFNKIVGNELHKLLGAGSYEFTESAVFSTDTQDRVSATVIIVDVEKREAISDRMKELGIEMKDALLKASAPGYLNRATGNSVSLEFSYQL